MSTALVWLRRDLRLTDHPALAAACAHRTRVLPVYIHSPQEEAPWAAGAASRWWLHHSLRALGESLSIRGGQLYLATGESLSELRQLIERTGADAVHWTRSYEPAAIARDTRIKAALREQGIVVESHAGNLWAEPWQVFTGEGHPYRVFTPFWRNLRSRLEPQQPLPEGRPQEWLRLPGSLPLERLELEPRIHWTGGLAQAWQAGEDGAHKRLQAFSHDVLADYAHGRDQLAQTGTSRLSPHLHFGEITPREIHYALGSLARRTSKAKPLDIEPYLRQLGWREFAHHLLYYFPDTPTENFNSRFDALPWAEADETVLHRWCRGLTGIPLVDAGMRELWHTGWMHNRARMIVASFLTKNLRLHWLHGARWFWDTLVDADLANNTLGWQWVAGCGADAAPYFRVFNPLTQAVKFDPEATYLKRWLPELATLETKLLHEPQRDPAALTRRGYPAPMIDLGKSRNEALEAWKASQAAKN